jgi:enamine deaminase RidA (YjgF/YER057c/UK114 family)
MTPPIQRSAGGGSFEDLAGYCRALRAGDLIYVSGTAARPEKGVELADLDTYTQTRQALDIAVQAAVELGGSGTSVVRTRLLLAPAADWQAASRAHGEVFANARPANTTWYVSRLIPEGALVEVELDAWARDES